MLSIRICVGLFLATGLGCSTSVGTEGDGNGSDGGPDAGADLGNADAAVESVRPARCDDTFNDIGPGDSGYSEVRALYIHDILNGCSDSPLSFCPNDEATRQQSAVLLIRAMGEQPSSAATSEYFDDINGFAVPSINRMFELGITTGCADRAFCPGDALLRDQGAVFLVRGMIKAGVIASSSLSNAASNAYFDDLTRFATEINTLKELEVTNGCTETSFCPQNATTRRQMAIFLARAFGLTDDACDA